MPWRKLLTVTSKWHIAGVGYHALSMIIGFRFLVSEEPIKYLAAVHDERLARFWALAIFVGGAIGLISLALKRVDLYLEVEAVGLVPSAVMWGWLMLALALAPTTTDMGMLALMHLVFVGVGRFIQVLCELFFKVHKAKKNPVLMTAEAYLASPMTEDSN